MKELFRSFEGKLNGDNRNGYVIYATGTGKILFELLNVYTDTKDSKFMIKETPKYNAATDWPTVSEEDITNIYLDLDRGHLEGEIFYKDKWYSPKNMIEKFKDYDWKKYI